MGRDAEATWSGLTAKEFAAETGLNAGTLTCWKWRLRRQQVALFVATALCVFFWVAATNGW